MEHIKWHLPVTATPKDALSDLHSELHAAMMCSERKQSANAWMVAKLQRRLHL